MADVQVVPDSLVFFTVANARYEPFVLPYLASVLHHNPGAGVEIRMERPEKFRAENRPALTLLNRYFPERFSLTKYPQDDRLPQKSARWQKFPASAVFSLIRWLETPERKAEFVYIGDIDILILEEVAPPHLAHMRRTGLPYSNMRRSNQPRLTGLHFTRYDAYYPQVDLDDTAPAGRDNERLLYWLVEQKGFGLPDPTDEFRPVHGYHMSIARNTASSNAPEDPGWGDFESSELLTRYLSFTTTTLWHELAPLLDQRYRQLLSMLDIVLAQRFPQETRKRQPASGTLPRDWW
jgi:hypothetical protein